MPILLFLFAVALQLCFFFILKARKAPAPENITAKDTTPVSVIICARNEATNLERFLPQVLQQDYRPELWEVIVVNDQSTDHSKEILEGFAKKYNHLRIIHIPAEEIKSLPGKKYALSKGIEAATFERLLLTDADCKPSSNQWLSIMAQQNAGVVLGYGAYETHRGILNKFIRWETTHTCMQYASYAAMGIPYMGVGRNLSYNKSLLKDLEKDLAFQEIYRHTPSGDDDLLICKIAHKENTGICLDKNAFTVSAPQLTWKTWWRQKTRHSSTGKYYPAKAKNLLGMYALSHALYWFLGLPLIISIFADPHLQAIDWMVPLLFFTRLFLYWFNAVKWYRQLNEKKIFLFYPLGDLGWAIYNVLLSPYIFWKNKQAWK
jgi:glycosyltransferase involved in cell wall biosynthesis